MGMSTWLPWRRFRYLPLAIAGILSIIATGGGGGSSGGGNQNTLDSATLTVTGAPEVVFDWTNDRCEPEDIPDTAARAFRDSIGQVQLLASHYITRRDVGPDLNTVTHDCLVVFTSERDADPANFNDAEWIGSFYTEDGETVYALIHNEHHGWEHAGQCTAAPGNEFECWYNAVTLAKSSDSGTSYQHPQTPPDHLIAALPYQYEDRAGPYGMMNPSNIVRGADGAYYALVKMDAYNDPEIVQWVCLMRTTDLTDPRSWRFWDGSGFSGRFVNPYTDIIGDPNEHICKAVDRDNIGDGMIESLTYNTYLNDYVLVGISADYLEGRAVEGAYYSFSTDLLHWTHRKLLLELPLPWTIADPADIYYAYPSLLDPQSVSRNFETTGETAYLYYMRNNAGTDNNDLDRDLLRVPVRFQK